MKLIFLVISLMSSLTAFGFTLTGAANNQGFADPKVTILINSASCPAGFNLRSVVSDAVKAWNGVPTSNLELKVGGESSATSASLPPVAYCDSTMTGNTLGVGGGGLRSDGVIISGFLRLNTNAGAQGYVLNLTYDQQVVVAAHELGHMLGLGHTNKAFSLMYYSIDQKTDLGLSQDDIDGITYLYPRDELSDDEALGGCGLVTTNSQGPGPFFWLIFAMPLVIFLRLRRSGLSRA